MIPSINYIIASYPGQTFSRRSKNSENCLDTHLSVLKNIFQKKIENNIDCLVKRITIIVTETKKEHKDFKNYYKFEKWKEDFKNIEIIFQPCKGKNEHHSYDQWIQGIIKSWDKFTHHIIIEDDYCIQPNCYDFDIKLYNIYMEKFKDNIGYLSSKYGTQDKLPFHAMISNGIISSDTLKKLNQPLNLFYEYEGFPQLSFSYLFSDNNIPIDDYTYYFRVPFWTGRKIINYSSDKKIKEGCFVPFQEL